MACAGCTHQSISVSVVALHWHRVKLFRIEDLFAHVWNLLLELANIWVLLLHNLLHQHWLVRLANRRQCAIAASFRAIPQDRLLLLLVVADVRIEFRYALVQLLVYAWLSCRFSSCKKSIAYWRSCCCWELSAVWVSWERVAFFWFKVWIDCSCDWI